mmetsp:Transcript_18122/g.46405  ORF Transcript_18122/g.46405 Transcript_18122/m.46405 type:complete len:227 (-) Transcript_18122:663-1343(-)
MCARACSPGAASVRSGTAQVNRPAHGVAVVPLVVVALAATAASLSACLLAAAAAIAASSASRLAALAAMTASSAARISRALRRASCLARSAAAASSASRLVMAPMARALAVVTSSMVRGSSSRAAVREAVSASSWVETVSRSSAWKPCWMWSVAWSCRALSSELSLSRVSADALSPSGWQHIRSPGPWPIHLPTRAVPRPHASVTLVSMPHTKPAGMQHSPPVRFT